MLSSVRFPNNGAEKGRYGTVYRCAKDDDATPYVIKKLPKRNFSTLSAVQRLCVGLKILTEPDAALRHPNILYLEEVGFQPSPHNHATRFLTTVVDEHASSLYTSDTHHSIKLPGPGYAIEESPVLRHA